MDEPLESENPTAWSELIAQRYQCEIDPALAEFWDSGLWQNEGEGEFRTAVAPETLLSEHPESIWPGLMPCHQLPIIGNDRGDYLAVRLSASSQGKEGASSQVKEGASGRLKEIVYWYHGGGDWIPWGGNLAEALVFNRLASRLPGAEHRHCVDAEPVPEILPDRPSPWFDFAVAKCKPFDHAEESPIRLAESMLAAGISNAAILAGLIAEHFDHYNLEAWIIAALKRHPNLGWVWEAAGRKSENDGRIAEAIDFYQRGSRCSVFTTQSVRLGTHCDEENFTKLSVSKLQLLAPETLEGDEYLQALTLPSLDGQQQAAGAYWGRMADGFESGSDEQLFARHMSAWDLGRTSMDEYAAVIQSIIECATAGKKHGRAAVADVHLRTLRHRYS